MIRETLSPWATEAFVSFYPNQAHFLTRTTTGASSSTQSLSFTSSA